MDDSLYDDTIPCDNMNFADLITIEFITVVKQATWGSVCVCCCSHVAVDLPICYDWYYQRYVVAEVGELSGPLTQAYGRHIT